MTSPRERLDRLIEKRKNDILMLGSMVEQALLEAVACLKSRNVNEARRIYASDEKINQKRFEIENECLMAIATQQPAARDLRVLASILEVNTELERMGDYAKGIARIAIMLGDHPPLNSQPDIPAMADQVVRMLHQALSAFVSTDQRAARSIPKQDDVVDAMYNQIHRQLLSQMIADPAAIDPANLLLWAAHNIERTADRVTNICERTIFIETGEMIELDISDDEQEKVMSP